MAAQSKRRRCVSAEVPRAAGVRSSGSDEDDAMPASPNKPTAAATPRGAADELRIRKIAEKCEDKAFKFAQQPVIGQPQSAAPPPAPRAPRLSEVRQAASARPSRPRQGGIPARAAASSVRAHGLWAGNDALLSSRDGNGNPSPNPNPNPNPSPSPSPRPKQAGSLSRARRVTRRASSRAAPASRRRRRPRPRARALGA